MNEPKPVHPSHSVWTEAFREFDALYEVGMPERVERLAALRDTAPALADAVRRLLAEHDARHAAPAQDWLQTLPRGLVAAAALVGTDPAPSCIGPWRLLRELGHGGTSRVWLARREDVPWLREVALKVPLGGWWRQDLRERLVRERDILSRLEHPHIARLYDAGFAEAQPWLALEYVQGQDIISWCDSRKASLCQRVALFRQVLQAVHYAHSALIVHRDLKPANILVSTDGSVRLLDFGIAKILAEGQDHTQTTQLTEAVGRMLTPAYASPEQLRNEPLTTATDVYSLGLVLYQLLTGVQPFADRPRRAAQIEQAIVNGQIALASRSGPTEARAQARGLSARALRRALAGDLEAMLSKATQADPAARYESAAAFDADLEAWLAGRPVRARRPTLWQYMAKLVRRHPWASGLGVLAACALAMTTVVALHQAAQARLQAEQARVEAARARSARDFLLGLFEAADPDNNGGRDVLARDLLIRGEQRIDRMQASEPLMKAEMLKSIGDVWWGFGDMENAARVLRHRSELMAVASPGLPYLDALLDEVQAEREAGSAEAGQARLAVAEAVAQRLDAAPSATRARLSLERAWAAIRSRSAYADGLTHLQHARALAQQVNDPAIEMEVLSAQALALRRQRHYREAVAALDAAEQLLQAGQARAVTVADNARLHVLRLEKARNLMSEGAFVEGWPLIDRLMHDVEARVGANQNPFALLNYRVLWFAWMIHLGQWEVAAEWVDANPARWQDLRITSPVVSAERYRWLAKLRIARSEWQRADDMLRRGLAVPGVAGTEAEAQLLVLQAEAQLRQLQTARAGRTLDQIQRLAPAGRPGWAAALEAKALRAVAHSQSGQWEEALRMSRELVDESAQRYGEDHPRTARARVNLGLLWYRSQGRGRIDVDAPGQVRQSLPVLQRCYPESGELLRLVQALDGSLQAQGRRAALPAPARFLDDSRLFIL
jgi:eukaryotic-like serine/threonine-protein kinase